MGQLRETAAPSCCFLFFLLLFLVAPCHGQPQDVAKEALSPGRLGTEGSTGETNP